MIHHDTMILWNTKNETMDKIHRFKVTTKENSFSFCVDTELDAYKAAYGFGDSQHGVAVKFVEDEQRWTVTVYLEMGARLGFRGSWVPGATINDVYIRGGRRSDPPIGGDGCGQIG